ncbi:MAG: hypothetical protein OEZ22_02150 [Spirochaetia bacterium]|nr:hypothetical protein [Spirochaetia bacterium]
MDNELLKILVCPLTKNKLEKASKSIIDKLNAEISLKKIKDISGELITESLTDGLFEPKNKVFYIIKDDIPILIYENGIKIK